MGYPSRHWVKNCIDCGKDNVQLSNKGLCFDCSTQRMRDAAKEMREKKGPAWDSWRKSMALFITRECKD